MGWLPWHEAPAALAGFDDFSRQQPQPFVLCFLSTLAQVSFSATVRLNTGFPGAD
jgi:hypothetical protein